MGIYRITVRTPQHRWSFSALFPDGFDAIAHTLADYPDASLVSAICIRSAV